MGMMDKAKKLADDNKDKVAQGVDKATDAVDKKTGGKHSDKLDKLDKAAEGYAGKDDAAGSKGPDGGGSDGSADGGSDSSESAQ